MKYIIEVDEEIKKCTDCPMQDTDIEDIEPWYCKLFKKTLTHKNVYTKKPEWCKLNKLGEHEYISKRTPAEIAELAAYKDFFKKG